MLITSSVTICFTVEHGSRQQTRNQIHQLCPDLTPVIRFAQEAYLAESDFGAKLEHDLYVQKYGESSSVYVKLAHTKVFLKPGDILSYMQETAIMYGQFIEAHFGIFTIRTCEVEVNQSKPEPYIKVNQEVIQISENVILKFESCRHDCVYDHCEVVMRDQAPIISHNYGSQQVFILNSLKHE
jgi:hypothetical protein